MIACVFNCNLNKYPHTMSVVGTMALDLNVSFQKIITSIHRRSQSGRSVGRKCKAVGIACSAHAQNPPILVNSCTGKVRWGTCCSI